MKQGEVESWLLLSTCQTEGLTNCLNLLNRDIRTTGIDVWNYKGNPKGYNAKMAEFSQVMVNPEIKNLPEYRRPSSIPEFTVPTLSFDGYHPDLCYVAVDGRSLMGPLLEYHSLIALAAYNHGFSEAETIKLYTAKTYERCGYFDAWVPARDWLIDEFNESGIDLRDDFFRWAASGPFMFSINHPRIDVLHDLAALIVRNSGHASRETHLRPVDNLAGGACFPIYPELGEALGVQGSYLFKNGGEYRYFDLEDYLKGSFEAFAAHPPGLQPLWQFAPRYERVQRVIAGEA